MLTNKHLKDLLPSALREIDGRRNERPDLILEGWSQVIEEKWRPMTQAISFVKGVLMVKVKNAALYSLLVQQEKDRLLLKLQEKFPEVELKNIIFRIG
ncbi:MAG TPA: DUF721 domain-containing protein [Rhabdochlamydiaceae bacterium]|jgi:hypothetical protein|nr:DUF721 domain-containing protein [Rhabdochlamydiaceae bacterium]